MMAKTTRSKGEAGGSKDGSWRRGAALVAPSSILSSFSGNISQRWRQGETDWINTTGKGCLAVVVRSEGRETRKRRVVALFLLLEDHPPSVVLVMSRAYHPQFGGLSLNKYQQTQSSTPHLFSVTESKIKSKMKNDGKSLRSGGKYGQEARKDRKSATGINGSPKKGGHGDRQQSFDRGRFHRHL
ncbi:unnamed protein product [Lactuca saligna]|uniref:Uncharacterized protein n=1 Tax=Lactuca saligna TaxID=75948 RepID=A0AA35ZKD6_LACSI|nr:unnamed protein product [Lactuca saligna]